jgi:nucleotide-binding universal stress UspA family protein
MNEAPFRTNPFGRILFCTDFSENADFAFDFAIDLATRRPGCTLYLLHVIPEPGAQFWKTYLYEVDDVDEKAKHDIDTKVAETYLPRVPEGVRLEVVMRIGKDHEQILDFAAETNVDLIVMGRQGRSSIGTVLFGNVTEEVTRKAKCAVLVIPMSFREKNRSEPGSA